MEKFEKNIVKVFILVVVLVSILSVGTVLIGSYYEMKSFNKFSTKQATLRDAIFLNLRVFADNKE